MIVTIDANILIYLFDDKTSAPISKATGLPVDKCHERVKYLFQELEREKAKIVIPTPTLAEVLVRAQEGAPERLRILKASKHFRIVAFDERAAVEFAATQSNRIALGERSPAQTRAKAKFDDQIVAIAAVEQSDTIYSDDEDVRKLAASKFKVIGIDELALPPENEQRDIFEDLDTGIEPS